MFSKNGDEVTNQYAKNAKKQKMKNKILEKKYIDGYDIEDELLINYPLRPRKKYGFIAIKNPKYLKGNWDADEYIFRKPNAIERKEIVLNTIIASNGRPFPIPKLAKLLAISDRTLQTLLRKLEAEKLIEIVPRYNKNGARKCSVYKYIGPPCEFYGSGLNLRILYNPKTNVGFRHWAWRNQGFPHDKVWHDVYKLCKIKFDARAARGKYLKDNNLPLVVPEKLRYLVLRYAYWKGTNRKANGNVLYSQDGTIKIPLFTQDKTKRIQFYEFTFELAFGGTKDNPEITITNCNTKDQLAIFTWFTENVIQKVVQIDKKHQIQFFILGDFTVK